MSFINGFPLYKVKSIENVEIVYDTILNLMIKFI